MRIGYSEEEAWQGQFALHRANTERAIRGKAGQAALRDLEAALLAMPRKRLVVKALAQGGEVCAIGALLVLKRVRSGATYEAAAAEIEATYKPDDIADGAYQTDDIADGEGVAPAMVAWRLVELNDIRHEDATPEERYEIVLGWVRSKLAGKVDHG